jgi:FecR protein
MNRSLTKTLAAAFMALTLGPATAHAQAPGAVGVVTTLAGEATVARATLPEPVPVRFRDPVFTRDRIATGEKSIVRVLLGGKALVTARELSILTISETPLRSTVTLDAGKVGASVIKARMQPGEIIEFRTPNAVAVVRGTVLVVEVTHGPAPADGGPAPITTVVSVINGLVDVFALATPGLAPVRVGGHESVRLTDDQFGALQALSHQEARTLTVDLEVTPHQQPQARELPASLRRTIGANEQAKAAALAGLLAPAVRGETTLDKTLDVNLTDEPLDLVDSALLEASRPILDSVNKLLGTADGTVRYTTGTVGAAIGQGAVGGATTSTVGTVGTVTGSALSTVGGGVAGGLAGATSVLGGSLATQPTAPLTMPSTLLAPVISPLVTPLTDKLLTPRLQ